MYLKVQIHVVRLDNKIVSYIPLEDIYSEVQIHLDSEYLTDEDIRVIYKCMSTSQQQDFINICRHKGKLSEHREAKDCCFALSRYSAQIEDYFIVAD